jgi:hypothetical protein
VTNLGAESQHYVDASGQPLAVRRWYRFWVLSFLALAGWLVYGVVAASSVGGFDAGAREGGAAASLAVAIVYASAWVQDVRHNREARPFWVQRNHRNAVRMLVVGVLGTVAGLFGVAAAWRAGETYVSGLLVAPVVAAVFCLALGAEVRRRQRSRGE